MATSEIKPLPSESGDRWVTLDPDAFANGRYGRWEDGGTVLIPRYLCGSDYSGTLVEVSNRQSFEETFADGLDGWWTVLHGGYCTRAIAIDSAKVPAESLEEVREFLQGLLEYPLADENLHSELETTAQNEAWESWAQLDFVRAVEKTHGLELDSVDADKVCELFYELSDKTATYWVNEQGSEVWIDIERIAKATTREQAESLRK